MHKHILFVGSGFVLGLALAACKIPEPNPEHCVNASGDSTCVELYGAERPYCTSAECDVGSDGYMGCVAERPADECYFACGDGQTVEEDVSCLGSADESADADSSDMADTTEPLACEVDKDCGEAGARFCGPQGECVACSEMADPDAACAGLDEGVSPVCAAGSCVQCDEGKLGACGGVTPVCDAEGNVCVGCSWHEECGVACNMQEGSCFSDAVFEAMDTDSLANALAEIAMLEPKQGVIVLHDGGAGVDHVESVTVPAGVTVAFMRAADQAEVPSWQGQAGPALTVEAGAVVYLQGIEISGTQSGQAGIVVKGGQLWVDRARVINNSGGGIVVDDGGALVLRNSFVGGNVTDVDALRVEDGSARINYTTLAGGAIASAAIRCAIGQTIDVRNSLLISRQVAPEVDCLGASFESNALETTMAGNTGLGEMMDLSWFAGYGAGDLHLAAPPAALRTAATWQPGDPIVDIDGDPRPTDDGTEDYAGADRMPI